jgi:hypothetical protein
MATPAGKHGRPKLKRYKKPIPIPAPKPSRPKRGDLKKIYKDLVSTDIDQRVTALAKAMQWYDHVQVFLNYKQNGKFTTRQLRAKNFAERNRAEGIKTNHSIYKETHFTAAINAYEIMAASYKVPKLKGYLRKYSKEKKGLIHRKERLQDKHGEFLKMLHDALQPVNWKGKKIKLTVDKISAPHRISAEGNITFDRRLIMTLRKLARKKGLLSAVLLLLPVLTEAAARESVVDTKGRKIGTTKVDQADRYPAVLSLLNNFNTYCQREDGPRTVVRRAKPKEESHGM